MPCYHPLQAVSFISRSGQREIKILGAYDGQGLLPREEGSSLLLPCGQCIGCRLERSRQWALRCMHEASLYDDNCFITLTYDDEHLPEDCGLHKEDFQLFFKRLRKAHGEGIRFFHCGEYGEEGNRPHYHACVFNFDFPDKVLFSAREGARRVYESETLSKLWGKGFVTLADLTFDSAAYVARYCVKKITGPLASDHYRFFHPETGQVFLREPEYATMSRRPGIGKKWLDKYLDDVYPSDFLVVNGHRCRPPKYYDRVFEDLDPMALADIKDRREAVIEKKSELTVDRLLVKEKCKQSKLNSKKRVI